MAHSCSRHGLTAAWLTAEWPDVIPVPRSAIIRNPCQILGRSNLDEWAYCKHGTEDRCTQNFCGKLERMKCRWDDDDYNGDANNNRMDLKETGWESVEWIHLLQDSNQWWTFINMIMSS